MSRAADASTGTRSGVGAEDLLQAEGARGGLESWGYGGRGSEPRHMFATPSGEVQFRLSADSNVIEGQGGLAWPIPSSPRRGGARRDLSRELMRPNVSEGHSGDQREVRFDVRGDVRA